MVFIDNVTGAAITLSDIKNTWKDSPYYGGQSFLDFTSCVIEDALLRQSDATIQGPTRGESWRIIDRILRKEKGIVS